MSWRITKDHIDTDSVGVGSLTNESDSDYLFRLYDDDTLCYEGRANTFESLDGAWWWGESVGAPDIRVLMNDELRERLADERDLIVDAERAGGWLSLVC
jgi:hypothetical protein